jgi:hypothetical protein
MKNTTSENYELVVTRMPARGKNGWVKQNDTFLQPTFQDSYGSSVQMLTFLLEDGIYEVQDANYGGRKTRHYWIKVENGQAWEIEKPTTDLGLKLPELQGSERQVVWAESIRQKAVTKLLAHYKLLETQIVECVLESSDPSLTSAKWWIDNRDRIDCALPAKLKSLAVKSIKPYPSQKWEPYKEECAHEGEGGELVWKCESFDPEVFPGKCEGEDFCFNIFCQHPETNQWEIWHYTPSIV